MSILEEIDGNFESKAKEIRYNFFEEILTKYNANYLFTAHYGDDLVETILMRIGRGASFGGMLVLVRSPNLEVKDELDHLFLLLRRIF